jgi:hypothetical protein
MITADIRLSQRVVFRPDADYSRRRVDLNSRLRCSRDRQMPRGTKERFNLDHSTTDVNSVQEPRSEGDRYGREYAQNAQRHGELDQGECIPHRSFRRIVRLDSI